MSFPINQITQYKNSLSLFTRKGLLSTTNQSINNNSSSNNNNNNNNNNGSEAETEVILDDLLFVFNFVWMNECMSCKHVCINVFLLYVVRVVSSPHILSIYPWKGHLPVCDLTQTSAANRDRNLWGTLGIFSRRPPSCTNLLRREWWWELLGCRGYQYLYQDRRHLSSSSSSSSSSFISFTPTKVWIVILCTTTFYLHCIACIYLSIHCSIHLKIVYILQYTICKQFLLWVLQRMLTYSM